MRIRIENTKWTYDMLRNIFFFFFFDSGFLHIHIHILIDKCTFLATFILHSFLWQNDRFDVIFRWNIEPRSVVNKRTKQIEKIRWWKTNGEKKKKKKKAPNLQNYGKFARSTPNVIRMNLLMKTLTERTYTYIRISSCVYTHNVHKMKIESVFRKVCTCYRASDETGYDLATTKKKKPKLSTTFTKSIFSIISCIFDPMYFVDGDELFVTFRFSMKMSEMKKKNFRKIYFSSPKNCPREKTDFEILFTGWNDWKQHIWLCSSSRSCWNCWTIRFGFGKQSKYGITIIRHFRRW